MKKANTDDNILINFGTNIKIFRREHNISQFELAVELDIDGKTLRSIENGESNVRYITTLKILKLFQEIDKNITLEELLSESFAQ